MYESWLKYIEREKKKLSFHIHEKIKRWNTFQEKSIQYKGTHKWFDISTDKKPIKYLFFFDIQFVVTKLFALMENFLHLEAVVKNVISDSKSSYKFIGGNLKYNQS